MRKRFPPNLSLALVFGLPGLLLLALSAAGIFPALTAASRLAEDAELSPAFTSQLRQSQLWLGGLLVAGGLLAGVAHRGAGQLSSISARQLAMLVSMQPVLTFGLTLFIQVALFQNIPHVTDAISHCFQAKILCLGRIFAPAPPCFEAFYQDHVIITRSGMWLSKYTPGHPLLLAGGMIFHAAWLVVPLASAAVNLLLVKITSRFYPRGTAALAGLLFAFSPLALLLGASFMSHTTFLAMAMGGVELWLQAADRMRRQESHRLRALAGGFLLAWAAAIRPQDFGILGMVLLTAFLLARPPFRRECFIIAGKGCWGALPMVAFMMWWNWKIYGRPLVMGYGFTPSDYLTAPFQGHFGFSEDFTAAKARAITLWTTIRFNGVMLGWPCSLLFIPAAFLARAQERKSLFCLFACAATVAVYFFYDYYGMEFEARYYYNLLPFTLVLTAHGLLRVASWLGNRLGHDQPDDRKRRLAHATAITFLGVFFAYTALFYWPKEIWPRYADSYEEASPRVHQLARQAGLERAVVLIDAADFALRYSSGFQFNDPLLRENVIYVREPPDRLDCLKEAFADRSFYRYIHPGSGGKGSIEFLP